MFQTLKKAMMVFMLLMVAATTGAWQNSSTVFAASGTPEIPLAPSLTWNDLGLTERNLQLSIQGDAVVLSGQTFQAVQRFTDGIPQDVLDFYSNVGLFPAGWASDNAFDAPDGVHRVFYNESGFYLAIEYLKCTDDAAATCVTVWLSAPKDTGKFIEGKKAEANDGPHANATFIKKTPVNSVALANWQHPDRVYLSWGEYLPSLKYSYCAKVGSACGDNDPNWTGTFLNRSITISELPLNANFFWQVKAVTDWGDTDHPKTFAFADGGWWNFRTTNVLYTISGNAGIAGAILKFKDHPADLITQAVTAASNGNYAFTVMNKWTGTVTPSKLSMYAFVPVSKNYVNVVANQVNQNYTAHAIMVNIKGTTGIGFTTLTYVEGGVTKKVVTDNVGNYSINVRYNFTGKITPSRAGVYSFSPMSRSYSLLKVNLINQYFKPTFLLRIPVTGAEDGFVTESSEYSDVGGIINSLATTLAVGDNKYNRELRPILSFNTSALPDAAIILSAKIKIKLASIVGTNPMTTHGLLMIDVSSPNFGASTALGLDDFGDPAGAPDDNYFGTVPVSGVYSGLLGPAGKALVDVTGTTQMRLHFQIDDNNDNGDDYMSFYSGNSPVSAYRPVLEVMYLLP